METLGEFIERLQQMDVEMPIHYIVNTAILNEDDSIEQELESETKKAPMIKDCGGYVQILINSECY